MLYVFYPSCLTFERYLQIKDVIFIVVMCYCRLVQWIPGVHLEVSWLYSMAGDISRQAQTTSLEDSGRYVYQDS